ncbi:MAG: hypothetical protein DWP98_11735 [Bacteroidetes bacterium]|nr:MAG: hypothetical protein DWP98_11735 [Bacteroidota bacterium]MBL1143996.1 hypothetical protein [Bacteroidota bacterium]
MGSVHQLRRVCNFVSQDLQSCIVFLNLFDIPNINNYLVLLPQGYKQLRGFHKNIQLFRTPSGAGCLFYNQWKKYGVWLGKEIKHNTI